MPRASSPAHEWLRLVEVSGPFVSVQALGRFFPQGLEAFPSAVRRELSSAYDGWVDALERHVRDLPDVHRAWVSLVLDRALGLPNSALRPGDAWHVSDESGVGDFAPASALCGADGTPRLFVCLLPPAAGPSRPEPAATWKDSPADKALRLCRAHDCPFALLSDGEEWTLVSAPEGELSGKATWLSSLFFQEPDTLRAFSSLLSSRRFLGRPEKSLAALFADSREDAREVTDALGSQVRSAVEVFVRGLDRIDRDRGGTLLRDVPGALLYEASLTFLMRLVFLLCAEERGLLLRENGDYDSFYAVSTLRDQLSSDRNRFGPEVLETRFSAYARLLALFRAVFGGIELRDLRLPALGGSLFDPDRFPFLEGRAPGSSWRAVPADPPPVDDRTVLHLLDALQILRQGSTAVPLSFRSLDVEQIGYIYEGLLEFTAERSDGFSLGLQGDSKHPLPVRSLERLEALAVQGEAQLCKDVSTITGRGEPALRRAYGRELEPHERDALLRACHGDEALATRVAPFYPWMRPDAWGAPALFHPGAFHLAPCDERTVTGAQYTQRVLTEPLVREALEPLVYDGPADGLPRREWRLHRPDEILSLKVCDPAMGSGAFLVQDCRYLAERLVESWCAEEAAGRFVDSDGAVCSSRPADPMPSAVDERTAEARRLVAERCLYGVDVNPLAVELAKLSLWLVTLAKDRPFGFLDHNLKSGDSLLGITNASSLWLFSLHPKPYPGVSMHTVAVERAVSDAAALREVVRTTRVLAIRDVETQAAVAAKADRAVSGLRRLADALVGRGLASKKTGAALDRELFNSISAYAPAFLSSSPDDPILKSLLDETRANLDVGLPPSRPLRRPFHWALEFPEVFVDGGFDAVIGNPPFLGGQKLTGTFGTPYRNYLIHHLADGRTGSADFVAYFFLRAYSLLRPGGISSLIATNTISEGDTRQVALEPMIANAAQIIAAHPRQPWPGTAGVAISPVVLRKPDPPDNKNRLVAEPGGSPSTAAVTADGRWHGNFRLGSFIDPDTVPLISAFLSAREEWTPQVLGENADQSFQGTIVLGLGFTMPEEEAHAFIDQDPKNAEVLFPCLNGEDLNSSATQKASCWVINFFDWPQDRSASGSWNDATDRERSDYLKGVSVPSDYPDHVAADFHDLFAIVKEKVKPQRDQLDNRNATNIGRRTFWWHYGRAAKALYHAIGRGRNFVKHSSNWHGDIQRDSVLICSKVSKHLILTKVPNNAIYTANTVVFVVEKYFPVLQSSIHEAWARQYSATLETRLSYTPTDCYETFPFPKPIPASLEALGDAFDTLRKEIMHRENIGLTDLYNAFHDSSSNIEGIEEMRAKQREIDEAVARTYGWTDLKLDHGFHEVPYLPENDRVRWTVSEPARLEILSRLSRLNHERAALQGTRS